MPATTRGQAKSPRRRSGATGDVSKTVPAREGKREGERGGEGEGDGERLDMKSYEVLYYCTVVLLLLALRFDTRQGTGTIYKAIGRLR